jgi:hypothetical protein
MKVMAVMSVPTLKTLMTERQWEQDWPAHDPATHQAVPADWNTVVLGSQSLPSGLDQVAKLLKRDRGAHPTIRQLREVIAALTEWNQWAEDILTFPATLSAFGAALAAGLDQERSTKIKEQSRAVAVCYPELSWAALNTDPALRTRLSSDLVQALWPTPPAQPEVPQPPALGAAVPVPAPSTATRTTPSPGASVRAPTSAPPAGPRTSAREDAAHAPRTYDTEARWPREKLLPIVHGAGQNPTALVSQSLDEALRHHYNATTKNNPAVAHTWTEDVLLPALMSLKAPELKDLMAYWPNSFQCEVKNPLDLVKKGLFWAQLRDAEPDAQRLLVQNVLPVVVKTDNWTIEDRLRMLRVMLSYTKNKAELFEQRLDLWQRWGGNLNEPGVLAKDRQAASEEDAFDSSSAAKSALDWIREQNVPVWNQWLAQRDAAPEASGPSVRRQRMR